MMKKIYIVLGFLVLTMLVMAYLYFASLNQEKNQNNFSLKAITGQASLLISFDNDKTLRDIISGQQITDDLIGEEKSLWLQSLRQTLDQRSELSKNLNGNNILMGFVPTSNSHIALVIATQFKSEQIKKIRQQLNDLKPIQSKNIYTVNLVDGRKCYIGLAQSTWIISDVAEAVEKVSNPVNTDEAFIQYIKKNEQFTKNTLARVYLNFNKMPDFLAQITQNKLSGELKYLANQPAYAALNYNFGSDKLLLNGYTKLSNPDSYISLFLNQTEQKSSLDLILPEQTANYQLYQISKLDDWVIALNAWQNQQQQYKNKDNELKRIGEKYRIDLAETLPKYFNQQFILAQLANGENLGVIAVKNADKLAQSLLDLSSPYNTEVSVFKEKSLLSYYFGEPFEKFPRPFYAIIDKYMVVANYPSTVQNFIDNYRGNRILSNTDNYKDFRNQISDKVTLSFYINNSNSRYLMGRNLKSAFYKQYQATTGFSEYNCFAYQLSGEKDKFMTDVLLLKKNKAKTFDSAVIDSLIHQEH